MESVPHILDGTDYNGGQGQEGNRLDLTELLLQGLKTKIYIGYDKYLDDNELIELWQVSSQPKYLTSNERIRRVTRETELIEKIDFKLLNRDLAQQLEIARRDKPKVHAGHLLGSREFTLTYSPKWFSDDEARATFRTALNRLIKYYCDEIIELRAIGEVGSNGLSHIHCFYKLQGGLKITDKNFKRAYKYWDPKKKQGWTGHQGGHHAVVKIESDFKGYIEKDIDDAWLDVTYPQK